MKLKRTHLAVSKFFTGYKHNEGVCAMAFIEKAVRQRRPDSIKHNVSLSRHQSYHPSPVYWSEKVLYFLLVDCFIDGPESKRLLPDRSNLAAARPEMNGEAWSWAKWAESGAFRWQGGTQGIKSKLGYLKNLSATPVLAGDLWIRVR